MSETAPLPDTGSDPADLAAFTRQLGAMLDAGVDVLRALRISSEYVGSLPIVQAADDIAQGMKEGQEFHKAASRHPELFDPFYVEMTRQGEADGILGKALLAVADYLDRMGGSQPSGEAPVLSGAPSVRPTAVTLAACGAGALGVAAVWSLVGSGKVAEKWLGPLSALCAGTSLTLGALALQRGASSAPGNDSAAGTPALPAKSPARRRAEAEGIVRSALQEQAEVDQERAAVHGEGPAEDTAPLPGGPVRGEYDPDPNLHRFEL